MSNGFEIILYLERKIWEILLSEMQEYEVLFEFKSEVKCWNPTNCSCKLCKTYIGGVGYVWMVGQYTPRDKSYESIRNVGLFNIKENLQSKFSLILNVPISPESFCSVFQDMVYKLLIVSIKFSL